MNNRRKIWNEFTSKLCPSCGGVKPPNNGCVSQEAIEYVKGLLRDQVTRREKLLLMVLADYHNGKTQAAYPSSRELAEESLMSKREMQKVLNDLDGRIIQRVPGLGAGHYTAYRFIALEPEMSGYIAPALRNQLKIVESPPAGDPNHCWYCGCDLTEGTRTEDHQTPVSRGGSDDRNRVHACFECNCLRKRTQTLEEYRKSVFRFYGERVERTERDGAV
jgi:Helix-turn-helix domain